jgi:two-component system, chemotaxis family, protein-glutamate methylesterase/glutaminase
MAKRDLIVVGASAGGVDALTRFCSLLPENLAAAVLIILHVTPSAKSRLPHILDRASPLPVSHAKNGDQLRPGQIIVAPPNHHLYIKDNTLYLSTGPRVNGVRPAIDILFQSAAYTSGHRVIGVILSGMLGDGANGLLSIKRAGGIALVQDPKEAVFSSMPEIAIQKAPVDDVLPIDQLVEKIIRLIEQPIAIEQPELGDVQMSEVSNFENAEIREDRNQFEGNKDTSPRTLLTCPDCGGVLWESKSNGGTQYHCQIGHIYSEESLVELQGNNLENALWVAVRVLEERSLLARRLASRVREKNSKRSELQFLQTAKEADETRDIIRNVLLNGSLKNAVMLSDDLQEESSPSQ